jgi:glycosyltransferase involved in cell wall biosynthesis
MHLVQVSPFVGDANAGGAEQRIHGLVSGYGSSDSVTRFVFDTYDGLSLKEFFSGTAIQQLGENYEERRVKNLTKSALNFSMGKINYMGCSHLWMFFEAQLMHTYDTARLQTEISEADTVLVEFPWQFKYIEKLVGDAFLVYSSHNVEREYHDFLSSTSLGEFLLEKFAQIEEYAVQNADLVVTVSERDAETYRKQYSPKTPFFTAPNATFVNHQIQPSEGIKKQDEVDAVFVGTNHPPNVEAAKKTISVAKQLIDTPINFRLIGTVCEPVSQQSVPDNVELLGYVENLDDELKHADIALNPVTTGSGSNVKLSEYLSYGLPVLTTPFGARGSPAEDGKHIIIASSNDFDGELRRITNGRYNLAEISRNAIQLSQTRLNWKHVSQSLFDEIRTHA